MAYTVRWDGVGLIKEFSDYVDSEEFASSAAAATSHPEFDRAKYVINDFSRVSKTHLLESLEYVAVIRLGASRLKSKLKVAYVSNCPVILGFVKELLSDKYDCGWETAVFADLPAALGWVSS
jgi:hypothetical protein